MRKTLFDFKIKKKDFFFNDREKKLFFIVIRLGAVLAGLCLAAVMIALLVKGSVQPPPAVESGTSTDVTPEIALNESGGLRMPIYITSFIIKDEFQKVLEPDYILFKERLGKWDDALVEKYWIPPARIGLEKLREINDKNIEELFNGIP